MRRLLAFDLLVSQMNTSTFMPQAHEANVYDADGNQLDDITNVVELIRAKLDYGHHADDENNDSGQKFHIVNFYQNSFQPFFSDVKNFFFKKGNDLFKDFTESKITSISYDILVPPPKV